MSDPAQKAAKKAARKARRKQKKADRRAVRGKVLDDAKIVKKEVAIVRQELSALKATKSTRSLRAHKLLKQALNPFESPALQYPDPYNKETHPYFQLINTYPEYGSNCQTTDPRYGLFYVLMIAHPLVPLWYLSNKLLTSTVTMHLRIPRQTALTGLKALTSNALAPADAGEEMVMRGGNAYNLQGFVTYDDDGDIYPRPQWYGVDTNGNDFYGVQFDGTGQTGFTVNTNLSFQTSLATSDSVTLTAVSSAGIVAVTVNPAAAGATQALSFGFSAANYTTLAGAGSVNLIPPGIGFRLTVSKDLVLTGADLALAQFSTAIQSRLLPQLNPDATVIQPAADGLRMTAGATLLSYMGSDLNNGGQIAGVRFNAGQVPMCEGLVNYQTVSEYPHAYDSFLKMGAYTWWRPSDPEDVSFKDLLDWHAIWVEPSNVIAGVVATPTQVNALRARCVTHWEMTTLNQIFNPRPSPVDLAAISEVAAVLDRIPSTMENPKHESKIRQFLGEIGGGIANVGKWMNKNKSWLLPAATGVAGLFL